MRKWLIAAAFAASMHAQTVRPLEEMLRLVSAREDMSPWAQRPSDELKAWLAKGVRFDCGDRRLTTKFYTSKLVLLANMFHDGIYDRPYLIEGGVYKGFWFESVPATVQVFARIDLDASKAQMMQFIKHQMPDGYLPYKIIMSGPGERSIGFGWIAFAAWHLYMLDGDRAFLEALYAPLGRWVEWMGKYRDANRNGIYEAWSPGDMGQDNSARFQGIRLHVEKLRVAPVGRPTPYDAPDASGLMHIEMLSLGEIADVLGKPAEARQWRKRAAELRARVNASLWDPATACYYDRDSKGEYVKMVSVAMLRALFCGLPTSEMARRIFEKHILNPHEFWTPCPLPSFAFNEPKSTPSAPDVWSGPTMCLTNLRAPYAFEHYGRGRELRDVYRRYLPHVARQAATFQQYHPVTGDGGASGSVRLYSPAAAGYIDGIARLYGIVPRGRHLEWNATPPPGGSGSAFEMDLGGTTYRLSCEAGRCSGYAGAKRIFRVAAGAIVYTDRACRRVAASAVRDFPRFN